MCPCVRIEAKDIWNLPLLSTLVFAAESLTEPEAQVSLTGQR